MNAEIIALACELPATTGVPLSRWSCAELARELVIRKVVAFISPSTIWRTLRSDAIRPWRHQSWIFPRDPDFAVKAARVLDFYAQTFEGQALGEGELAISADEKTSIQARCGCHPTLPPGKARLMRVEHEYERQGAVAYLAAYDVHRAQAAMFPPRPDLPAGDPRQPKLSRATPRSPSRGLLVVAALEAVQQDETFMDDHEVAADHVGTRDNSQVQFVVRPDAYPFSGRPGRAKGVDPVRDHGHRE